MHDLAARLRRPRVHVGALIGGAVALFVPYAIAGPGFFIDDWFALANGALDDWWMSAGAAQWRARPGASAVYAITFGLIGERPLIHFALAAVLIAASSIVIYRIATRFLPRRVGFAVAALWLLLPTHTSLEMWPSCLNIALSLLLLLLGVERLTREQPSLAGDLAAGAMFGVGTLCYEAIAPAAGAVAVVVALRRPSGERLRAVSPAAICLLVAGAWMVANWHPDKEGLGVTMNPWFIVPAHFGETITGGARWAEVAISGLVLVVSLLAAADVILRERRASANWRHGLVVAGWATIGLGALPFVRYFYSPIGLGDRVLVVSSIGGAMVLVGAASFVQVWRPILAVLFLALVIPVALAQRASMVGDYAVAADDGRRIHAFVRDEWPQPPREEIVFGPEPIVRRNVVAFYDIDSSIRLLYDDPAARSRMTFAPAEFFEVPVRWRVDIRPLSELDDGYLDRDSARSSGP